MTTRIEMKETNTEKLKELVKVKETLSVIKGEIEEVTDKRVHCFDIETTTVLDYDTDGKILNPITWLYHWQYTIAESDEKMFTVYGRTWKQYRDFVTLLCEENENINFIIFVHNLSYEGTFLLQGGMPRGCVLEKQLNSQARKPISLTFTKPSCINDMSHIEFRCSYMLSNLSLSAFAKQQQCKRAKKVGDLDYSITRTPTTPLTQKEQEYCYLDTECLAEAIHHLMTLTGFTQLDIPYTSTGFVRREVKAEAQKHFFQVRKCIPCPEVYQALRRAYRGGNTHANRFKVGQDLKNVSSFDMSSAYPSALCTRPYPTIFNKVKEPSWDIIEASITSGYAVLAHVIFSNISTEAKCPYISKSTCEKVEGCKEDNGRILKANVLDAWLTDLDLRIICNSYSYEAVICDSLYIAEYKPLPDWFTNKVKKYYELKTTLKNVSGKEGDYAWSKAKLNSVYGMCVQVLDKPSYYWGYASEESKKETWYSQQETTYEEEYNHIWEKETHFFSQLWLPYQWGVWTSAWCRYMLQEGIQIAGDNFVYCDTDSVKFLTNEKSIEGFKKLNVSRESKALKKGFCFNDPSGEAHPGGVYECDAIYKTFKTYGAKRYAYVYSDDKVNGKHANELGITIAGVNKKIGAKELLDGNGLDDFKENKKFTYQGVKVLAMYVDDLKDCGRELIKIDDSYYYIYQGEACEVVPYVSICNTTYTLGIEKTYNALLHEITGARDITQLEKPQLEG